MFEITVKASFSAAHYLSGVGGPEGAMHGHDFHVTAVLTTESVNTLGMVAHDRDMKKMLGKVIAPLDHASLNDMEVFSGYSPTLESIAHMILVTLKDIVPSQYRVESVSVQTEDAYSVKSVDKLQSST